MILLIDNYDSFTYNIVHYLYELRQEVIVKRHDEIDCADIASMQPDFLVIGPGPCSPKKAGICIEAIQTFSGQIPILGICLGHQAIGEAFGGQTVHAKTLMHGKLSAVYHDGTGVFQNVPNPVTCTRYHSLVTSRLPEDFIVNAWTDDQEIMGIRHRSLAVEGVQFHPEALLTEHGHTMLANFLNRYQK